MWSVCPSIAECLDTGQRGNLVDSSWFFSDAAGTLPAFSLVVAGGSNASARGGSCHNGASMTACDNYIGKLVSDGSHLYLASDGTTIDGTAYDGSVRSVDPATGAVNWQTGLAGSIIGTPGMDGAGLIAAASYVSMTNQNGVFLIDAATGQILKTIPYTTGRTFAQPMFADGYLFVAGTRGLREYKV